MAAPGVASKKSVPPKMQAPPAPQPQAPIPKKNGSQPGNGQGAGTGDFVDEIIAALDATFTGGTGGTGDLSESPAAQDAQKHKEAIDGLFAEIAATYAKPIRDFMSEVYKGTATKDWLEICRPALKSIGQAARSMHLTDAAERMDELDKALAEVARSKDKQIAGALRDAILMRYQRVMELMPQAFAYNKDSGSPKDGVIINSLLKQIPDVSRVTLEKLYSAGLTSLDTLQKATPRDLCQATGIQMRVAEQIVLKIKQYKDEAARKDEKSKSPQDAYRLRLNHVNQAMRRAHDAYERSTDEEEKRKLRSERKNCAFQISIVLAELGEVALVKELEKLTFERRIQTVDEYVARTSKR
jgi:hypothetical protein